jgi:hypothetical protein
VKNLPERGSPNELKKLLNNTYYLLISQFIDLRIGIAILRGVELEIQF